MGNSVKFKNGIKFIISFILIFFLLYFLNQKGCFLVIKKISFFDITFLTLLTLLSYFINGFQIYYLVKTQNNISISLIDTLMLPLSMSLFSYIIPANGGLLYSVYFLKKKYNISSSKGFSIGIVSIYISFIITGIFGLISVIITEKLNILIFILSILLIFSPVIINFLNAIFFKFKLNKDAFFYKVRFFFNSIISETNILIMDKSVLIVNIITNVLYFVITLISYQYLNLILKINLTITSIFLIILISKISSLIRFLPGNIGVEELYMASVFKLVGKDPSLGLVVSLILRITTVILFIPFGIIHTFVNFKYINISKLKKELKE